MVPDKEKPQKAAEDCLEDCLAAPQPFSGNPSHFEMLNNTVAVFPQAII